jgi:hypothetical protein
MTATVKVPHVHAEVIKAWASGEQIQMRVSSAAKWQDMTVEHPYWDAMEYRIKPEKLYPVTQMDEGAICSAYFGGGPVNGHKEELAALYRIANAALRHACDANQIISMVDHQDALTTLGKKLRDAEITRHAARDMAIAEAVRDACRTLSNVNLNAIIKAANP